MKEKIQNKINELKTRLASEEVLDIRQNIETAIDYLEKQLSKNGMVQSTDK